MQCVDRRGLYYPTARTVAMVTLASCMITRLATSFEGAHAQRPRSPGAPVRLQRGVDIRRGVHGRCGRRQRHRLAQPVCNCLCSRLFPRRATKRTPTTREHRVKEQAFYHGLSTAAAPSHIKEWPRTADAVLAWPDGGSTTVSTSGNWSFRGVPHMAHLRSDASALTCS